MADSFHLKVVTPAGIALEEEVSSVTLPTSEGEIGVLPGHVQYIALLGVGILTYTKIGGESQRMVVTSGFCQFAHGHLTVLADQVDTPQSVDVEKLTQKKPELSKVVDSEDTQTPHWQHAREQLSRIEAVEQLVH